MGYRTYLAIIEKKKLNKLRKCNSMEDVLKVFKEYGWDYSKDDDYIYCPVYKVGYLSSFEFGKYYDNNEDDFYKLKKRIFRNKELDECYEEYNFEYGDIGLIELAIEDCRQKISNYFKNLGEPKKAFEDYIRVNKSEEELKEMHYQKLVDEVKFKQSIWAGSICDGYYPYNTDKDKEYLVNSWLREYQIFDLLRMYKMFDPKKHYVVYYGW